MISDKFLHTFAKFPPKYLKLSFAVLLAFALIPAANATNVSLLYVQNGNFKGGLI